MIRGGPWINCVIEGMIMLELKILVVSRILYRIRFLFNKRPKIMHLNPK
jgi:hypothetical protein